MALVLVVLGPLPFWALGLPWVMRAEPRRIPFAPLVGCSLAGLYAEFALILGLPVRVAVGALVVLSAVAAIAGSRRGKLPLARALAEWAPLYLISVLVASLSPFPVVGSWSGDWFLLYKMGQSVLGGTLQADLLARPPLFGAAAVPLWIVAGGLPSYQIMAAVASASAVTAMFALIDHYWPRTPRFVVWPLLASPFFLNHTAAAWGKFLAAGLILAAILEGLLARRIASAALFALSVAVHEGSIVWAPFVLVAHASGGTGWRGAVRALGPMALCAALIVGPLQAWILIRYGLAAKVASSPVITDSHAIPTPFWLKTVLAVVTTFIGWGPAENLLRWIRGPHPLSGATASKEIYWLISSWYTTLAGTLVGLLFPFAIVPRRQLASPALDQLLHSKGALAALAFAIVATAALCGFYGAEGTMQAALVALALGLYGLGVGPLGMDGRAGRERIRAMTRLMVVAGTVPWTIVQVSMTAGLRWSPWFRTRLLAAAASEGDYAIIVDNHLTPLGMSAFPEVPLLCLALLGGWMFVRHSQGGSIWGNEEHSRAA